MDNPNPANIETLRQIWQGVFRRPIDVNEDFFDLGGNAWLAAELFTEINNQLGINAVPVTLCQVPTIAKLAAALRNPQPCGPAVLLKRGAAQATPVFMLHGIGSSVIDLVPLVRRMQVDQAVSIYGLEAKGNDGREAPLDRIEKIAQSFVAPIREIQPRGPYFLIGYSLGGLVALELAQQLKTTSEQIGLLVMIDSYPDRRYLSFAQRSRLLLQLARRRMRKQTNAATVAKQRLVSPGDSQRASLVHALQQVKDAHYRALHNYRPRFYDGEVKFIRAAVPSSFPADPVPFWSRLVRRLEVETVPGEHVSMLSTGAEPLASVLLKYASEAP
jgi:thioesterase domain-containing protein